MLRKISLFLLFVFSAHACDDYYIIFLVNARQLDYSNAKQLFKTIAKHPSDLSKNGDVGHAWIYLHGDAIIEGGHSGELGIDQPKYMDGVVDNIELGAKNPISYLWCPQCDGFFQSGNGGHRPTCAAKASLTKEQFEAIYAYIQNYNFKEYSITKHQCCHFVKEIAAIAGFPLEDQVVVEIDPKLKLGGVDCILWQDPSYQYLKFGSPDRLEYSLREYVRDGLMENVLPLYHKTHQKCFSCQFKEKCSNLRKFPMRYLRCKQLP